MSACHIIYYFSNRAPIILLHVIDRDLGTIVHITDHDLIRAYHIIKTQQMNNRYVISVAQLYRCLLARVRQRLLPLAVI